MTDTTKIHPYFLDEKRVKAAAGAIERFLDNKGLSLPHTQALDLMGVLAGQADWRSLRAALSSHTKASAGQPTRISLEEFVERFKPVQNHLAQDTDFEGYAYHVSGAEGEYIRDLAQREPGRVWTIVDGENTSWLTSGWHFVNREYYVVTSVPAPDSEFFEIAYGHSDEDTLFEITVFDNTKSDIAYKDSVYATSAQEAREMRNCDIDDEVSQILEAGGQPYVIVEPVST